MLLRNYNTFSSLKEKHKFALLEYCKSEVLNYRCRQSCVLWQVLGKNPLSCLFKLLEANCISWLLTLPFIIPTSALPFTAVTSPILPLTLLPSSFKEPGDYNGDIWIIQENYPILTSLIYSRLWSPFNLCMHVWNLEIRTWVSSEGGALFSLLHLVTWTATGDTNNSAK